MLRAAGSVPLTRSERPSLVWRHRDYSAASTAAAAKRSAASFEEYLSRKPIKFYNPGMKEILLPKLERTELELKEKDPIRDRIKRVADAMKYREMQKYKRWDPETWRWDQLPEWSDEEVSTRLCDMVTDALIEGVTNHLNHPSLMEHAPKMETLDAIPATLRSIMDEYMRSGTIEGGKPDATLEIEIHKRLSSLESNASPAFWRYVHDLLEKATSIMSSFPVGGTMREQIDWFDSFQHLILWPEPKDPDSDKPSDPDHPEYEEEKTLPRFITLSTELDSLDPPEKHFWRPEVHEREELDPVVDESVDIQRFHDAVEPKIQEHLTQQLDDKLNEEAQKSLVLDDNALKQIGVKDLDKFHKASKLFAQLVEEQAEVAAREESRKAEERKQNQETLADQSDQRVRDAKLRTELERVITDVEARRTKAEEEAKMVLLEHKLRDQILQAFKAVEDEITTQEPHPYIPGAFKRKLKDLRYLFLAQDLSRDRAVYYAWMFGYTHALQLARSGTPAQMASFELEVNEAVSELFRPTEVDGSGLPFADEQLVQFERAREAFEDDQRVALASFGDAGLRPEYMPTPESLEEPENMTPSEERFLLGFDQQSYELQETRDRLVQILGPEPSKRDDLRAKFERYTTLLDEYLHDAPALRAFEERVRAVRTSRLMMLLSEDIMNQNTEALYETQFDTSDFKSSLFEVYDTNSLLRALATNTSQDANDAQPSANPLNTSVPRSASESVPSEETLNSATVASLRANPITAQPNAVSALMKEPTPVDPLEEEIDADIDKALAQQVEDTATELAMASPTEAPAMLIWARELINSRARFMASFVIETYLSMAHRSAALVSEANVDAEQESDAILAWRDSRLNELSQLSGIPADQLISDFINDHPDFAEELEDVEEDEDDANAEEDDEAEGHAGAVSAGTRPLADREATAEKKNDAAHHLSAGSRIPTDREDKTAEAVDAALAPMRDPEAFLNLVLDTHHDVGELPTDRAELGLQLHRLLNTWDRDRDQLHPGDVNPIAKSAPLPKSFVGDAVLENAVADYSRRLQAAAQLKSIADQIAAKLPKQPVPEKQEDAPLTAVEYRRARAEEDFWKALDDIDKPPTDSPLDPRLATGDLVGEPDAVTRDLEAATRMLKRGRSMLHEAATSLEAGQLQPPPIDELLEPYTQYLNPTVNPKEREPISIDEEDEADLAAADEENAAVGDDLEENDALVEDDEEDDALVEDDEGNDARAEEEDFDLLDEGDRNGLDASPGTKAQLNRDEQTPSLPVVNEEMKNSLAEYGAEMLAPDHWVARGEDDDLEGPKNEDKEEDDYDRRPVLKPPQNASDKASGSEDANQSANRKEDEYEEDEDEENENLEEDDDLLSVALEPELLEPTQPEFWMTASETLARDLVHARLYRELQADVRLTIAKKLVGQPLAPAAVRRAEQLDVFGQAPVREALAGELRDHAPLLTAPVDEFSEKRARVHFFAMRRKQKENPNAKEFSEELLAVVRQLWQQRLLQGSLSQAGNAASLDEAAKLANEELERQHSIKDELDRFLSSPLPSPPLDVDSRAHLIAVRRRIEELIAEGQLDSDPLKRVEFVRLHRELRSDAFELNALWARGEDNKPAYQIEGQDVFTRMENERQPQGRSDFYALQLRDVLTVLTDLNEVRDILTDQATRQRVDSVATLEKLGNLVNPNKPFQSDEYTEDENTVFSAILRGSLPLTALFGEESFTQLVERAKRTEPKGSPVLGEDVSEQTAVARVLGRLHEPLHPSLQSLALAFARAGEVINRLDGGVAADLERRAHDQATIEADTELNAAVRQQEGLPEPYGVENADEEPRRDPLNPFPGNALAAHHATSGLKFSEEANAARLELERAHKDWIEVHNAERVAKAEAARALRETPPVVLAVNEPRAFERQLKLIREMRLPYSPDLLLEQAYSENEQTDWQQLYNEFPDVDRLQIEAQVLQLQRELASRGEPEAAVAMDQFIPPPQNDMWHDLAIRSQVGSAASPYYGRYASDLAIALHGHRVYRDLMYMQAREFSQEHMYSDWPPKEFEFAYYQPLEEWYEEKKLDLPYPDTDDLEAPPVPTEEADVDNLMHATMPTADEWLVKGVWFNSLSPFLPPRLLREMKQGDIVQDMLDVVRLAREDVSSSKALLEAGVSMERLLEATTVTPLQIINEAHAENSLEGIVAQIDKTEPGGDDLEAELNEEEPEPEEAYSPVHLPGLPRPDPTGVRRQIMVDHTDLTPDRLTELTEDEREILLPGKLKQIERKLMELERAQAASARDRDKLNEIGNEIRLLQLQKDRLKRVLEVRAARDAEIDKFMDEHAISHDPSEAPTIPEEIADPFKRFTKEAIYALADELHAQGLAQGNTSSGLRSTTSGSGTRPTSADEFLQMKRSSLPQTSAGIVQQLRDHSDPVWEGFVQPTPLQALVESIVAEVDLISTGATAGAEARNARREQRFKLRRALLSDPVLNDGSLPLVERLRRTVAKHNLHVPNPDAVLPEHNLAELREDLAHSDGLLDGVPVATDAATLRAIEYFSDVRLLELKRHHLELVTGPLLSICNVLRAAFDSAASMLSLNSKLSDSAEGKALQQLVSVRSPDLDKIVSQLEQLAVPALPKHLPFGISDRLLAEQMKTCAQLHTRFGEVLPKIADVAKTAVPVLKQTAAALPESLSALSKGDPLFAELEKQVRDLPLADMDAAPQVLQKLQDSVSREKALSEEYRKSKEEINTAVAQVAREIDATREQLALPTPTQMIAEVNSISTAVQKLFEEKLDSNVLDQWTVQASAQIDTTAQFADLHSEWQAYSLSLLRTPGVMNEIEALFIADELNTFFSARAPATRVVASTLKEIDAHADPRSNSSQVANEFDLHAFVETLPEPTISQPLQPPPASLTAPPVASSTTTSKKATPALFVSEPGVVDSYYQKWLSSLPADRRKVLEPLHPESIATEIGPHADEILRTYIYHQCVSDADDAANGRTIDELRLRELDPSFDVDKVASQLHATDPFAPPGQPTLQQFLRSLRDRLAIERIRALNRTQEMLPDLRGLRKGSNTLSAAQLAAEAEAEVPVGSYRVDPATPLGQEFVSDMRTLQTQSVWNGDLPVELDASEEAKFDMAQGLKGIPKRSPAEQYAVSFLLPKPIDFEAKKDDEASKPPPRRLDDDDYDDLDEDYDDDEDLDADAEDLEDGDVALDRADESSMAGKKSDQPQKEGKGSEGNKSAADGEPTEPEDTTPLTPAERLAQANLFAETLSTPLTIDIPGHSEDVLQEFQLRRKKIDVLLESAAKQGLLSEQDLRMLTTTFYNYGLHVTDLDTKFDPELYKKLPSEPERVRYLTSYLRAFYQTRFSGYVREMQHDAQDPATWRGVRFLTGGAKEYEWSENLKHLREVENHEKEARDALVEIQNLEGLNTVVEAIDSVNQLPQPISEQVSKLMKEAGVEDSAIQANLNAIFTGAMQDVRHANQAQLQAAFATMKSLMPRVPKTVSEFVAMAEEVNRRAQERNDEYFEQEVASIMRELDSIPSQVMGKAEARIHALRRALYGLLNPLDNISDRDLLLNAEFENLPLHPKFRYLFELLVVDRDAEHKQAALEDRVKALASSLTKEEEENRFASLRVFDELLQPLLKELRTTATTTNAPEAAKGSADLPASYLSSKLPSSVRHALELPEPPLHGRDMNAARRPVNLNSMPDVYRSLETDAQNLIADFPAITQPLTDTLLVDAWFQRHRSAVLDRLRSDANAGSLFAMLALSLLKVKDDHLILRSLLLRCLPTPEKLLYDVAIGAESLLNSQRRASEIALATGTQMQDSSNAATLYNNGSRENPLPAVGSIEPTPVAKLAVGDIAAAAQRTTEETKLKGLTNHAETLKIMAQLSLQEIAAGKTSSQKAVHEMNPDDLESFVHQREAKLLAAAKIGHTHEVEAAAAVARQEDLDSELARTLGPVHFAILTGQKIQHKLPDDFYERLDYIDSKSGTLSAEYLMREELYAKERKRLADARSLLESDANLSADKRDLMLADIAAKEQHLKERVEKHAAREARAPNFMEHAQYAKDMTPTEALRVQQLNAALAPNFSDQYREKEAAERIQKALLHENFPIGVPTDQPGPWEKREVLDKMSPLERKFAGLTTELREAQKRAGELKEKEALIDQFVPQSEQPVSRDDYLTVLNDIAQNRRQPQWTAPDVALNFVPDAEYVMRGTHYLFTELNQRMIERGYMPYVKSHWSTDSTDLQSCLLDQPFQFVGAGEKDSDEAPHPDDLPHLPEHWIADGLRGEAAAVLQRLHEEYEAFKLTHYIGMRDIIPPNHTGQALRTRGEKLAERIELERQKLLDALITDAEVDHTPPADEMLDVADRNPILEGNPDEVVRKPPLIFGRKIPKFKTNPAVKRTKEQIDRQLDDDDANSSTSRVSHALHKMLMKAQRIRSRAAKTAEKQKHDNYWNIERPMQEFATPSFWRMAPPKVTHPPRYYDEIADEYQNIWKHADLDFHVGRRRLDFKIRNHFVPHSKWIKAKALSTDFFSRFGNTAELYKHPHVDVHHT